MTDDKTVQKLPDPYWVAKSETRITLYRNTKTIFEFRRNMFNNEEILANVIGLFAQAHDLGYFHAQNDEIL